MISFRTLLNEFLNTWGEGGILFFVRLVIFFCNALIFIRIHIIAKMGSGSAAEAHSVMVAARWQQHSGQQCNNQPVNGGAAATAAAAATATATAMRRRRTAQWQRQRGGGAQGNGGSAVAAARRLRQWRQQDSTTSQSTCGK